MSQNSKYYKTEIVTAKYPFSIAKIFPKEIRANGSFSNKPKTVYNVEAFGSVKYLCGQLGAKLEKEYPDFRYHIYAWRATAPKLHEDRMVHRLKFFSSFVDSKKTIHVDVELLPEDPNLEQVEKVKPEELHADETFDVTHLDAKERTVLASLFKMLAEQEEVPDVLEEVLEEALEETPETPLLKPRRLRRADPLDDEEDLELLREVSI